MSEFLEDDDLAKELFEAEQEKKMLAHTLELNKIKFISEMKGDLGKEIKSNTNKFKVVKPTFKERLLTFLTKIFTKF